MVRHYSIRYRRAVMCGGGNDNERREMTAEFPFDDIEELRPEFYTAISKANLAARMTFQWSESDRTATVARAEKLYNEIERLMQAELDRMLTRLMAAKGEVAWPEDMR